MVPRPTPAREARDDLPQAHSVWRRPSGVSNSSQAGALSPRDHLFSEFPWSACERATAAVAASRSRPLPRARGMAAHAEAAPRVVAARRQPAAAAPGRCMQRGGWRAGGKTRHRCRAHAACRCKLSRRAAAAKAAVRPVLALQPQAASAGCARGHWFSSPRPSREPQRYAPSSPPARKRSSVRCGRRIIVVPSLYL